MQTGRCLRLLVLLCQPVPSVFTGVIASVNKHLCYLRTTLCLLFTEITLRPHFKEDVVLCNVRPDGLHNFPYSSFITLLMLAELS